MVIVYVLGSKLTGWLVLLQGGAIVTYLSEAAADSSYVEQTRRPWHMSSECTWTLHRPYDVVLVLPFWILDRLLHGDYTAAGRDRSSSFKVRPPPGWLRVNLSKQVLNGLMPPWRLRCERTEQEAKKWEQAPNSKT